MGRLFGTDGARGVANKELTCELAMNIGKAAAMVLTDETHKRPFIVIGKDTRISSDMLENALAAGFCSVGADVQILGVIPTPAVAMLVRKYNADAGVMISASHNPCEFNGIKIFNSQGYKLSDSLEEQIENIVIDNIIPYPQKIGGDVGKITYAKNAIDDYVNQIKSTSDGGFEGIRVAVDCANGSSSVTARHIFGALGLNAIYLSDMPDGTNINRKCGSTYLENLKSFVTDNGLDAGFAFDGDADRFLAVDENGNEVDG
ncbi:MAG: phosphoglucosamine mutase, partial [Acutalibacteraceae bacterium]